MPMVKLWLTKTNVIVYLVMLLAQHYKLMVYLDSECATTLINDIFSYKQINNIKYRELYWYLN